MSEHDDHSGASTAPMSSVTRDLQHVRANSASTAKELRTFLSEMKGRSPKDMLGMVAQSNLFKSLISAAVLMAVLILALTIVPYALNQFGAGVDVAEEVAAAEAPESPAETSPPDSETAKTPEPAIPVEPTAPTTNQRLEDQLGIGESRDAPAEVNPLEGAADDLFKDFE